MPGYKKFIALKSALIEFFYAQGDLLPLDQPNGINHLYTLFDLHKNEVDKNLLNISSKKREPYLIDLENQNTQLASPFGELFIGAFSLPECQQTLNKIPLDTNDGRSAHEVQAAMSERLFSDSLELERRWTGGIAQYPTPEASTAFFATLTLWQKIALRYKHVHNITLGINEHTITKRNIWGMVQQVRNDKPVPNSKPEHNLEWKGDIQELGELLYIAERAGMLNIKRLREESKLEGAMHRFCEGISFTKPTKSPGKALYNCLIKVPTTKLGFGNLGYPNKNNLWGSIFISLDKDLKDK